MTYQYSKSVIWPWAALALVAALVFILILTTAQTTTTTYICQSDKAGTYNCHAIR